MFVSPINSLTNQAPGTGMSVAPEGTSGRGDFAAAYNAAVQQTDELSGNSRIALQLSRIVFHKVTAEDVADQLASAKRLINLRFAQNDISTTGAIDLYADGYGQMRVRGNLPDKEKIEQLFADDAELNDSVRMALNSVETLARMQESMAFQAAYARDQRSAVAQYAYLLTDADNNASHFYTSLKYEGGQWTVREQPEAQYKLRYRTYSSESNKPNIMDFF